MPKPFQPDDKSRFDASRLPFEDKLGVFVTPPEGLPDPLGAALAAALVEALADQSVPASLNTANRASYLLTAEASPVAAAEVALSWRLIDAMGEIAGLFDQVEPMPRTGDRDAIAAIATRAAARIAGLMRSAALPGPPALRIVLGPVDGARGDGREALARAMRQALEAQAVEVLAEPKGDDPVLLGSVRSSRRGAEEMVEILWSVIGADGAELGSVSQSNTVPLGALDERWGPIAGAVAGGGATGVVAILQSLTRSKP